VCGAASRPGHQRDGPSAGDTAQHGEVACAPVFHGPNCDIVLNGLLSSPIVITTPWCIPYASTQTPGFVVITPLLYILQSVTSPHSSKSPSVTSDPRCREHRHSHSQQQQMRQHHHPRRHSRHRPRKTRYMQLPSLHINMHVKYMLSWMNHASPNSCVPFQQGHDHFGGCWCSSADLVRIFLTLHHWLCNTWQQLQWAVCSTVILNNYHTVCIGDALQALC
jgi:hypothetical protein